MIFMMLRRHASEVRSLTQCGLCGDRVSARDHLLAGPPGTTAGVGLCARCGDALVNLTAQFGGNLSLKIDTQSTVAQVRCPSPSGAPTRSEP